MASQVARFMSSRWTFLADIAHCVSVRQLQVLYLSGQASTYTSLLKCFPLHHPLHSLLMNQDDGPWIDSLAHAKRIQDAL